ncbi:hypothetical protein O988_07200, partial [Pseudogymnoascus sp. VKM F-3808]
GEHVVEGGGGGGEVAGEPEDGEPGGEDEALQDTGELVELAGAAVCKVPSGAADYGLDLEEGDPEYQQNQERGDCDAQRQGSGVGVEGTGYLAQNQLG